MSNQSFSETTMQLSVEQLLLDDEHWQQLCKRLQTASSLSAIVLTGRQMGLWIARAIVEQQLHERAIASTGCSTCLTCSARLVSKGFVKRQMLTLVGQVEWKRRVERCPHRCLGGQLARGGHAFGPSLQSDKKCRTGRGYGSLHTVQQLSHPIFTR